MYNIKYWFIILIIIIVFMVPLELFSFCLHNNSYLKLNIFSFQNKQFWNNAE